jgi:hypothetical protein
LIQKIDEALISKHEFLEISQFFCADSVGYFSSNLRSQPILNPLRLQSAVQKNSLAGSTDKPSRLHIHFSMCSSLSNEHYFL